MTIRRSAFIRVIHGKEVPEAFMTPATRTNPLSYLTDQLNELKAKGTHFKLRVLDDVQAPV